RSVCCYGFVATRGRDRYSWFWVFRIEVLSVEEGRATFLGLSQKSPKTSILDSGSCRPPIDDPFVATGSWRREEEIAHRGSRWFEVGCCQWDGEELRLWSCRTWRFGFRELF
ncbi:hypothetical protein LINPERPRIM_LOCUS22232, partial [Linum perenne]